MYEAVEIHNLCSITEHSNSALCRACDGSLNRRRKRIEYQPDVVMVLPSELETFVPRSCCVVVHWEGISGYCLNVEDR